MRVSVLGTFQAQDDGRPVDFGRRQERLLLALLAVEPGQVISIDRLLDLIWDGHPPVSARAAIHTYVARLRSAIRPAGLTITSQTTGYVLTGAVTVDVVEMRELAERADSEPDLTVRADLLRDALERWRGPFLADVASDRLRDRLGRRYADLRTDILIRRADTMLALGRPDIVVRELAADVGEPLPNQTLVHQQMQALHRTQRSAEALDLFDRVRREYADAYGLDLSRQLAEAQVEILRDQHVTGSPGPIETPGAIETSGPNQLPRAATDFVGRSADLETLDRLFDEEHGGLVTITALGGMSGVGKTATALQWAHSAESRFPHGRFYVNLRGYDLESPLTSMEALAHLLRGLGVANNQIPADEESAAAQYRELLDGRRALIVLDNARSADQVRPLLPGSDPTAVLVTSRDRLAGLIARDGARLHTLGVLPPNDAMHLLKRLAGADRVDAERDAAERILALIGYLPLATRIVGAHVAMDPELRIESLVTALHADRLGELSVDDDPRTNIRLLFQHSYDALDEPARRMLLLFGAAPLIDITAAAGAALAGIDEAAAAALLHRLADRSLLNHTADTERFAFHDLIREFARNRAADCDDSAAATQRLLDWYVATARGAVETLHPVFIRLPHIGLSRRFESADAARGFLDAEVDNIRTVAVFAAGTPNPAASWLLTDAVRSYFWAYGSRHEWLDVADAGLAAAATVSDRSGQAAMYCFLGSYADRHQEATKAIELHRAGLELSEEAGWDEGVALLSNNLGNAYYKAGQVVESERAIRRAYELNVKLGRWATSAVNLVNIALAQGRQGNLTGAAESLEEAVAILSELGDDTTLPVAYHNLGNMRQHLGEVDAAAAAYAEALAGYRAIGNRDGEGLTLSSLATLRRDQGDLAEAESVARDAMRLLEEIGEETSALMAGNTLGTVLLRLGRPAEAIELFQASADLARSRSLPRQWADGLVGIARARLATGELEAARASADQARKLAEEHGMPLSLADALLAQAEIGASTDPAGAVPTAEAALKLFQDAGAVTAAAQARALLVELTEAAQSA